MHVTKMQACGNDYCVVKYESNVDFKKFAVNVCNRKLGIGSEGLIIVKENPLEMILFNPNGSKELMSGNAIRCFSKYCYDNKIVRNKKLSIITGNGEINVEIIQEIPFLCQVNMGKPNYNNQMIYVNDDLEAFNRILKVKDLSFTSYSFNIGGVQTVIFVDEFDDKVVDLAYEISEYRLFTRKTNVSFVKIIDKKTIEVRTYLHDVGWTLSSGAGCCAAAVVAYKLDLVKPKIKAILEYGFLEVEINKKGYVYLTGPATTVFSCEYEEE
ncbi:MAG: diaminopimelate epimerase [Anaeroplasma sp.]